MEEPQMTPAKRGKRDTTAKEEPKAKEATPAPVLWKKEPELTNALLTHIEESDPHWQIFGFSVIRNAPPRATGDTAIAHCRQIATKLLVGHPSGRWKEEDADSLAVAVKNHISWLKSEYTKIRDSLSETGQGINPPDEIEPNTALANLFDGIRKKLPYYWRMCGLLYKSLKLEPSLAANGASMIDTSSLECKKKAKPVESDYKSDDWAGLDDDDECIGSVVQVKLEPDTTKSSPTPHRSSTK
ncbi:hypothetical protein FRC08_015556 [Ceratobasidium sp. 394]|nr:hypothetical protein FRC08_015556 [Ceratobasidium sp. 394]